MNVAPLALRTQMMDQRIISAGFLPFAVGRATDDQIQRSWVRFPPNLEIFSLPRAISHFLSRSNAQ